MVYIRNLNLLKQQSQKGLKQGAAGAMRAHLANYVASKHNLRPATYSAPEYRSLMHGPNIP